MFVFRVLSLIELPEQLLFFLSSVKGHIYQLLMKLTIMIIVLLVTLILTRKASEHLGA
jgi:hypothetical protein